MTLKQLAREGLFYLCVAAVGLGFMASASADNTAIASLRFSLLTYQE